MHYIHDREFQFCVRQWKRALDVPWALEIAEEDYEQVLHLPLEQRWKAMRDTDRMIREEYIATKR